MTPRPSTRRARPTAEPLEGRALLSGALTLAKPVTYPAGATPADLVTADFNGDGHPDVAVVNYAAGTISVLMNDGDGTFAAPVAYPVGPDPQSIAVGDFNGDGHPDLVAVGNGAGNAYVLLNAGDGTFAPAVAYPLNGTRPEGVAVADVNGDGLPDIVTANEGSGTVSVLANVGGGTFAAPANFVAGVNPIAVAAADLNGDGHVDLVTLDANNDLVHVSLNKGDGTFPLFPTAYDVGDTAQGLTIADVNNDARPDILVTNLRSANVTVLPNVGDGTFGGSVVRRTGSFPYAVAVADLNGDNRPDIVTADNRNASIGVLVRDTMASFNHWRTFAAGTAPEAVAVADVNGDGRPDVITANFNDDDVGVLLNQTTFTPLTPTAVTLTASQNPVQLAAPLTLTATVAPAPAKGGANTVKFLDGAGKLVGTGTIDADGLATVTTSALPVGVTSLTAQYNGNGFFAPAAADLDVTVLTAANSSPLLAPTAVVITSAAGRVAAPRSLPATVSLAETPVPAPAGTTPLVTGPFVAATAVTLTGPTAGPLVPGDEVAANLTLTNQGSTGANGAVAVALSIAPAGDPAAVEAVSLIDTAAVPVALAAGAGVVVPVVFTLPATLTDGDFTVSAAVTAARGLTAAQVGSTPVAAASPVPVARVLVPFVPGDAGSVAVTIANQGPGRAAGAITVSLSIAPVNDPAAAVPLAVSGASTFAVDLPGGATRAVPVRFTLPATLGQGQYTIAAALTPARTLTAAQVTATPTAAAVPVPVVLAFGGVGVHRGYVLTTTLSNGAVVSLAIRGNGTGGVVDDGNGAIALTLANTAANSTLTVTPRSGTVTLASLSDPYPLGGVDAPAIVVGGTIVPAGQATAGVLSLSDGVKRLTVAGAADAALTIGPAFPSVLSLGTVTGGTTLLTSADADAITIADWSGGGGITAAGVRGALTIGGGFDGSLSLTALTSVAGKPRALPRAAGRIDIAGAVASPTWLIGAAVGPVRVGSVAANFSASVDGPVVSLTVTGSFAGVFAAGTTINSVDLTGDLAGGTILAGATLGPAAVLGDGDDTFNVGRIGSVQVGGNVTAGSLVAAGIRPTSDAPFTSAGATLLRGGAINRVTVVGTVDPTAQFLAASVPAVG